MSQPPRQNDEFADLPVLTEVVGEDIEIPTLTDIMDEEVPALIAQVAAPAPQTRLHPPARDGQRPLPGGD